MKDNNLKLIYCDCRKAMRTPLVFYILESCLGGILSVYIAKVLGSFADSVFQLDFSIGIENLLRLILCLAATILILPFISALGQFSMLRHSLIHDRIVLERFLDKEYASAARYELGDIQHRLDWDPTELRCYYVDFIYRGFMIPVTLAFLLFYALPVSPIFTGIVFVVSLIKLTVPMSVKRFEAKYDKQTREYQSKVRSYESEITEAPHTVRMFGLSESLVHRLDDIYQIYFKNVQKKSIQCTQTANGITGFLDTFCTVILLVTGALFVSTGNITPGSAAAMIGYFSVINTVLENISFLVRKIPIMKNNAERMILFYEEAEDLKGKQIEKVHDISAKDISFAYGDKTVFDHVSFDCGEGEKIAIVGANGSGKSTLIKILCGLLKHDNGCIRLDHEDIRSVSVASWRNLIAYAPQEPMLFSGTVKENIHLGNLASNEEDVRRVMAMTGIDHLAERTVSAAQNDFSGGEKQKISIARAILKNTPILILDEPSNNLDLGTQEWLHEFIVGWNKTILFISHDDRLIAAADRVIQM